MAKKYRINQVARDDLHDIYAYGLNRWGEQQADQYFNAFFQAFSEITERPESFQQVDHIKKGYRRCVCGVDSIYFRIDNDVVEIMTIIGHQDIYDLL